ncbi:hypothetical protein [Rhodalgimonas zhirmunskyi]|uniref:Uncharacterized protein n=1 Tax=Rhodalgimonas zhirmunskyi TaxID=2964767 RepID=A0AAJ1UGT9_9RHOB|nr:hypothetical protein [Rhodoalgimonas zhirmunskyi]MDQ2095816.1 hypothetical protein [Rhodoalgimonas zhirmunskyi]
MRVWKHTDHTLIVEDTPWIFGLVLIIMFMVFASIGIGLIASGEWMGLMFLLIGLTVIPGVAFLLIQRVQVVFYRPEGWVEIRRINLLKGRQTIRHKLDEISRAIVQTSSSGKGTTYRVALVIDHGQSAGTHPLTTVYSNVGKHHNVADAINAWLSPDQQAKAAPPFGA